MRLLLLLLALVMPLAAQAQAPVVHTSTYVDVPGSEPRERMVDILRMTVNVRFEPEKALVKGTVTHVFRALREQVDSIEFDAIKITIKQATLGGRPVRTRSTDTTVIVYCEPRMRWDQQDSIVFTYEATPRKGIYFIGWNDPSKRMRRQIWTQGQAIDNRHWIPMYDEMNDKMITETITTFDSTYAVLSNGTRYKVTSNSDGTKTWYYTMTKPHASYLLMLAIGNYAITDRRSASGVPLRLYSYPEHPERIEPTYRMSVESMDFLEREIGIPYPWESYSQVPVADYIFGAMENTTATIFGDFLHTDERGWLDRSYVGTNVHELTHQWFGDYITGRSGKSIWLQESFATFYPHLFTRATVGEDAYQWSRRGMHRSAHAAAEKDRLPIVHPSSGSARIYPKGASVIDMMRYTFGEQSVRRVIQHYLRKHPYTTVETNDLYLAFQDTLGLSPKWFFDQWLYQGGEPHYRISTRLGAMQTEKGVGTTTLVDIEQIHQIDELTSVFSMPVVLEVHYTDRTKDSVRVMVNQQRMLVEVPNPNNKVPAFVLFDPGSYILKRVTFDRSWDARMAQLQNAPLMIDRYDALETFRGDTSRSAERRAMLSGVLSRETFHALRSEAAQQAIELAQKGIPEAWELVKRGLTDKALEVRSATLGALPTIPQQLRETVVGMLRDTSYAVIQSALTKLATSFPSDKSILAAVKGVRGPHERVRITRLEIEATWNDDAGAIKELADLCGPGWEFITRQNAMQALRRVGTVTPLAAENMLLAVLSTNTRLAGVAQSVLNGLCEQPRLKSIVSTVAKSMQLNEIQRDTLAQYLR